MVTSPVPWAAHSNAWSPFQWKNSSRCPAWTYSCTGWGYVLLSCLAGRGGWPPPRLQLASLAAIPLHLMEQATFTSTHKAHPHTCTYTLQTVDLSCAAPCPTDVAPRPGRCSVLPLLREHLCRKTIQKVTWWCRRCCVVHCRHCWHMDWQAPAHTPTLLFILFYLLLCFTSCSPNHLNVSLSCLPFRTLNIHNDTGCPPFLQKSLVFWTQQHHDTTYFCLASQCFPQHIPHLCLCLSNSSPWCLSVSILHER